MKNLRYGGLCLLFCGVLTASAQDAAPAAETVHLGYELTLTHCKASDCHTDSAAKGVADIALKPQDAGGAAGEQTVPIQAAGVKYSVVIKASSQGQGRHVDVVLNALKSAGANAGLSFNAHEAANCVAWNTLPLMTLTADPYTDNGEQVTPALHLKVVGQ